MPTLTKPRFALLAAPLLALTLSCGGGTDGSPGNNPTTPAPPSTPPRQLTGIEINSPQDIVRVGQEIGPLLAYGQYDDNTTGQLQVTWSSSDPGVATIGEDGLLKGIAAGEVDISATFEGTTVAVEITVDDPNPRHTTDQPDDISGPQVHAVYALPSDVEDENWDRFGYIANSFNAIQLWLSEEIGYRLRLDTYQGELDVTYVRLPFTHQEGDGLSGNLVSRIAFELGRTLGVEPNKMYAVYYAGRSAGVCGSAPLGGHLGAVYVHREGCSNSQVGADPEMASTYEGVMVHELLHAFGAVPQCALHEGMGAHTTDDPDDIMFVGVERGTREGANIDRGRDDYFGHGRSDCLDTARDTPFWEPIAGGARLRPPGEPSRMQIPARDWPLRCEVALDEH